MLFRCCLIALLCVATLAPAAEIIYPNDGRSYGAPKEGGPISPDGVPVQIDFPESTGLRTKNVGGRDGAGLCVFSSIGHSARYQNELALWDFQKMMRAEPGGGYPEKVDKMIAKYAPGTRYIQYSGKDPKILDLAIATGRMPAVTYNGKDVHYHGQSVSHMVNLVHLDRERAAILDNNFVGENELVWMSREEFLQRWKGFGQGWAVILLQAPTVPVPHHPTR